MNEETRPDPDDIERWMKEGEGDQVEFISIVPSVLRLSQIITAFANTRGGTIIFGLQEHPTRVTGITSWGPLSAIFERAVASLKPGLNLILHQVPFRGKTLGVIKIPASETLIVSPAGAFVRRGESTLPMAPEEVQTKLPPPNPPGSREIAEQYALLTSSISELRDDNAFYQSWRGQWKGWLISALIGAVLGMPTGFAMSLAASYEYEKWNAQRQVTPSAVAAPTNVVAKEVSDAEATLNWNGSAPFYKIQRRTKGWDDNWHDWETIINKKTASGNSAESYDDQDYPGSAKGIQYQVGSWNDANTPPSDSQWTASNIITHVLVSHPVSQPATQPMTMPEKLH